MRMRVEADDVLKARVNSEKWSVVFTITRSSRTPAPDLFDRLLEAQHGNEERR
jgi:hypothetical protein